MDSKPEVVRGPSRVAMMPLDADGLPAGPWEDIGALDYLDAVNDAVVSLDLTPLVRAMNEVTATFVLATPQFRALMRALRYRPPPTPPLPWSRARMARRRSRR